MLLLTLAALSSDANQCFVRLLNPAALMLVSLLLALGLTVGSFFGFPSKNFLNDLLRQVSHSRLGGVLGLLLFAGMLNIDIQRLHAQRLRVPAGPERDLLLAMT